MRLTSREVASALGAPGPEGTETVFERVSTDTREDLRGCLFVALRGENFDGHDFITRAVENGVSGIVYSHGERPGAPCAFRVADTLDALGALGLVARKKLNAKVAGITGSFGKTTTKEMAVEIMGTTGMKILATAGNLNNRVGMPKTLLGADGDEKFAVLELGISLPGEMAALSAGLRPDAALITGVGAAHTEGLGDVGNVAAEKMKIADWMEAGSVLLLPFGDPLLVPSPALKERGVRVMTFGWDARADITGSDYVSLGEKGSSFTFGESSVTVSLPGRHNAQNALAACALARAMGIALPGRIGPVGNLKGAPLRGEIRTTAWGAKALIDCYNANPGAVAAALSTLAELSGKARKIAVLGEMRELGDLSIPAHEEMGRLAVRKGVSKLLLYGKEALPALAAARAAGMDNESAMIFDSHDAIAEKLAKGGREGDWILIKGSRSTRLDIVADLVAPSARKGGNH